MYHFIINPNSRSGAGARIWSELQSVLDKNYIPYKAYFTEYPGHAVKLAASVCSSDAAPASICLVAVGGDGTIQEVLSGIPSLRSVRFGYIPTGSGNDFCRSMQLPQKPLDALNAILSEAACTPMDVAEFTANGQSCRFAISCGIGFDAAVCHEINRSPLKKFMNRIHLGKFAYLLIGLKQLLLLPPVGISIETENGEKHFYEKVFLTAVMNHKYEGGGFRFCPEADSHDGFLDVIIVEGMRRPALIFCLFLSIFGKHTVFRGVHQLRCKAVTVRSSESLAVHKDGESAGICKKFTASLAKDPVQVILPGKPVS